MNTENCICVEPHEIESDENDSLVLPALGIAITIAMVTIFIRSFRRNDLDIDPKYWV